jgi:glycosyltransferase involved in cell wall biosynthesis
MRIVMLLHKSVEHDARVRREAKALQEGGHDVVVVHLPRAGQEPRGASAEGYEIRSAAAANPATAVPGAARRALAAARIARIARRERPDAIHAHDAAMLAPGRVAVRRSGAMLVYDSHELATEVPYHSRPWSGLVSALERLVVPRCDAVITVSDGIAERLQEKYGLSERPTVVRNLPDLPPPRDADGIEQLRESLGVDAAPLVLHQGAVAADRGCETLLRSLEHLDGAHLVFLGAEGQYVEGLRRLSTELDLDSRVHFHAPVPLADLLSYSSQADVGVTLLEDTSENHRLALPNKAFEYIAAGIPVVASDLPELRRLIERYAIGWSADPADPVAVAGALRQAIASRDNGELRARLARAAEELSWRREKGRLLELYERLGERRSPGTSRSA